MQTFQLPELEAALRQIDEALQQPVELYVVGGAAIGLYIGPGMSTKDIDYVESNPSEVFAQALEKARAAGLAVPMDNPGAVFCAPYLYRERCEPVLQFSFLRVLVPERHDLALMKVARGGANDMEAIEALHRQRPLDLEILTERYFESLTQVSGALEDFRANFAALIERLFGEVAGDTALQLPLESPHHIPL